jgi:hypothetical protein
VVEMYVEARQPARAIELLHSILSLEPESPDEYKDLLAQLQDSAAPR